MTNIYTSSYTGEQVDAAVAGVNNLISGSTPAAKATADANGNNIADTYATQTGTYSGITVGNATNATNATNANQLGGVDAASYAQLSQVVRTDAAQSLTDEQKQQARDNINALPVINTTLPSLSNDNVSQSTLKEFCDSFNLKYGESTTPLYFESGTNYSNIQGLIQPSGVTYKQYNFLQVTRQNSGMYMITVYSGYNSQVQMTIPPQYFFVSGGGISPATGNYALKSEVVKLSATNNVTTNKEEWGIGAASGAGTYLIGTFKIYDTNIHLRVTGGSGSSITTDIDILINCTNYAIDRAVCYANTLYTSSTLTGVYCTLDSSHNLRIYIASPNYGKFFVSASIVGGTIVDKGSSSTQSPSNGFYISTKYYLSLDPTALDPSSGDSWSVGLSNSVLPNGEYLIALSFLGVIYYGEAIVNNGKWISVIPIDNNSSTVTYAFLSKMGDNVTLATLSGEVGSTSVSIARTTTAIVYYYKKL